MLIIGLLLLAGMLIVYLINQRPMGMLVQPVYDRSLTASGLDLLTPNVMMGLLSSSPLPRSQAPGTVPRRPASPAPTGSSQVIRTISQTGGNPGQNTPTNTSTSHTTNVSVTTPSNTSPTNPPGSTPVVTPTASPTPSSDSSTSQSQQEMSLLSDLSPALLNDWLGTVAPSIAPVLSPELSPELLPAADLSRLVSLPDIMFPQDNPLLDTSQLSILPNSPLYAFVELNRTLADLVTVDEVADAQLSLLNGHLQMLESLAVLQRASVLSPQVEAVALKNLEASLNSLQNVDNVLSNNNIQVVDVFFGPEVEANFLSQMLNQQIILNEITTLVSPDISPQVEALRQQHLTLMATVLDELVAEVDNPELVIRPLIVNNVHSIADLMVTNEILSELEQHTQLPTVSVLDNVQAVITNRISDNLAQVDPVIATNYLAQFVVSAPGNLLFRLQTLEEVTAIAPTPFVGKLTKALERQVVAGVYQKLASLPEPIDKFEYLSPLVTGQLDDLYTLLHLQNEVKSPIYQTLLGDEGVKQQLGTVLTKAQTGLHEQLAEHLVDPHNPLWKSSVVERIVHTPTAVGLQVIQDLKTIPGTAQQLPAELRQVEVVARSLVPTVQQTTADVITTTTEVVHVPSITQTITEPLSSTVPSVTSTIESVLSDLPLAPAPAQPSDPAPGSGQPSGILPEVVSPVLDTLPVKLPSLLSP